MEPAKVSFTVRRPTPISRAESSGPDSDAGSSFKVPSLPRRLIDDSTPLGSPLARSSTSSPRPKSSQKQQHYYEEDSSDEDNVIEDELVTGFDKFGVQRLNGDKKKVDKPLVIPALKNKDWREQARKRKGIPYVPPSAAAVTGADGSVGGLGTKDTINSGPVLSGLQIHRKERESMEQYTDDQDEQGDVQMTPAEDELTDDQRALQALLAEAGGEKQHDGPIIDIIHTPVSEADALKQDVEELPDEATMADYARVPVSQFGAALLRGMGWKEGTAATRKPGKGIVEPYLPAARPALLGIGAKEQEVYDDGSKNKKSKYVDKRYVPIIKQDRTSSSGSSSRDRRDRSRSPRRDSSRRNSPDRYSSRNDRDGDSDSKKRRHDDDDRRDRDKDRSRRYESDTRRTDDRDKRYGGDKHKERERGSERDRDRGHSDRKRDRSRESSRRKDY